MLHPVSPYKQRWDNKLSSWGSSVIECHCKGLIKITTMCTHIFRIISSHTSSYITPRLWIHHHSLLQPYQSNPLKWEEGGKSISNHWAFQFRFNIQSVSLVANFNQSHRNSRICRNGRHPPESRRGIGPSVHVACVSIYWSCLSGCWVCVNYDYWSEGGA